jgi:hypothetical protein
VLICKILRNALDAPDRGMVCMVGRNPDATWFDDYEDRVVFDEAGLYEYARIDKAAVEIQQTVYIDADARLTVSQVGAVHFTA